MSWFHRVLRRLGLRAWDRQARSLILRAPRPARLDLNAATRTDLLRKSRYFAAVNPILSRLAGLFECYTVGAGIRLIPSSSDPEWNARARRTFETWALYPDLESRQSFSTLQGLIARAWFLDGEVFVLMTSDRAGRPRLQLIGAEQVRSPLEPRPGARIVDGVELDNAGQPVAYHLADEEKKIFRRIDARSIIHVFEPERPGQLRGIPFISSAINTLHDLQDLQDYEVRAAKAHAQVAKFWKRAQRDARAVVEELYRGGTTSTVESTSTGTTPVTQDAGLGEVIIGEPGDDIQLLASNRPSIVTQEFWKFLIASVCAGAEMPFQIAFPEFSGTIQGTALRAQVALMDTWFQARFQVMAAAIRRVFVYVIEQHMESDAILRARPDDWRQVTLIPPRRISVDAGYDSEVTINELNAKLLTLRDVLGSRGIDWQEHLRQIAEEQRLMNEMGLQASASASGE